MESYDLLKFSVQDSGIGIKKKNHKKLFKIFSSIKNTRKNINTRGIGLGLCISKLIVDKFKGEINFKSKYKRGSKFWFTFEAH
jgi:K+-sensing histidine kinase KdpD